MTTTLETVAHCWNYFRLLRLHLSQFVISPPRSCQLVATVCYCPDDAETVAVLRGFETIRVERVRWNFVPLAAHHLCRRAIGRNRVALASSSDWLLFCDVDYCFGGDSLDRLAAELPAELARGGPVWSVRSRPDDARQSNEWARFRVSQENHQRRIDR